MITVLIILLTNLISAVEPTVFYPCSLTPTTNNMANEKLVDSSKAVKALRKQFQNGEIDEFDTPKQVYESKAVYQEHKLDNFRTKFNKLKSEFFESNEGKLMTNQFIFTFRNFEQVFNF